MENIGPRDLSSLTNDMFTHNVPKPVVIDGDTYQMNDEAIAAMKTVGFVNLDKLMSDGKITKSDFPWSSGWKKCIFYG